MKKRQAALDDCLLHDLIAYVRDGDMPACQRDLRGYDVTKARIASRIAELTAAMNRPVKYIRENGALIGAVVAIGDGADFAIGAEEGYAPPAKPPIPTVLTQPGLNQSLEDFQRNRAAAEAQARVELGVKLPLVRLTVLARRTGSERAYIGLLGASGEVIEELWTNAETAGLYVNSGRQVVSPEEFSLAKHAPLESDVQVRAALECVLRALKRVQEARH